MAATKRKQPPARRAKRSLLASRPALPALRLALEPHQVDIVGLALVAIGIFLAGVAYLGWSGGALGNAFVHGRPVRVRPRSATRFPPRWWPAGRWC